VLLGTDAVKVFFGSKQTLQRVRHRLFLMRDVRDLGTDRIMDATRVAVDDPVWRDSIKILATVHPAAVLRETGLLEGFKADLAQMRTVMGGLTFLELLSLIMVLSSLVGGLAAILWGGIDGQLKGAIIMLMLIGGYTGVKEFWFGSSLGSKRKDAHSQDVD
jgi:hypothetical protein